MVRIRAQLQQTLSGTYDIERELHGGGMSRVFVATEIALGRKVVIKVLAPEQMEGVSVERFKREIQTAARLQHPHVVGLINAGETNGIPYYTMPFVEGQSLRSYLNRTREISIPEAIGLLRDVAKALAYAHDHGVVHRDIKPDNVLITGGTAVVTDFGIAKAIAAARSGPQQETITQIGSTIGTPTYMAPEQAAADPRTNHRADIYSFGVMAYEMLAGRPPFMGRAPQQLLAAQMTEPPAHITAWRADVPPLLAELVMRCLEKEPDARPQSARNLVKVLEDTSGGSHPAMPMVLLGGRPRLAQALALWAAASVGVVIVARAAIIALGLPDWVFPGAIIVMGLCLPAILFTYFVHRGAHRALTAPTNVVGAAARPAPLTRLAMRASPHVSWKRTTMGGLYALGTFTLAVAAFMVLRAFGVGPVGSLFARGALQKNERVLVADFRSTGTDTTLGPVVTEAFRTGLGQSLSIAVMPASSVRDVLLRMRRDAHAPVDLNLAREISTREGIKAFVDGSVLSLGGRYTLSARLTDVQTGETLAALQESAASESEILSAIDRLTRRLRERIGESLKEIRAAAPLDQVSTPSLEALRKYVQGERALTFDGDWEKGKGLLEEAIALDTAFAMAYRKLAVEYDNRGVDPQHSIFLITKAYEHRDRLSEAERHITIASYYSYGPDQDLVKSTAAYEALLDIQPTNAPALNNAANDYFLRHDFARAHGFIARAAALPYMPALVFGNLGNIAIALGDTVLARNAVRELENRHTGNAFAMVTRVQLLYALGMHDSAAAIARDLQRTAAGDPGSRIGGLRILAGIHASRGRVRDARRAFGEIAALETREGVRAAALNAAVNDAWLDGWTLGDLNKARRTLDRALAATPVGSIPHLQRPYVPLVSVMSLVGRIDQAKAVVALFDKERESVRRAVEMRARHTMRGDIALAEGRYAAAASEYRAAGDAPAYCYVCLWPREADAQDRAGNADSAIALLARYIRTPDGESVASPWDAQPGADASYLAASYKRLAELWEQKGDRDKALGYYASFADLWKNADPELQPKVAEVRKRIARLSDGERR
jgi:tetratricopeptide (TPR) repeat protein/TolB-like protein